MDNYSCSSYAESDSSPRCREIVDCENQSWDEPASYKVKFMCSFGGKIHPRPHDNQLSYVGGDTKILTVDRNIKLSAMVERLSSLSETPVSFKYQLPGEDLDALISVTNDEDLEHMMLEYDRLHRTTSKPARLRLFLFPVGSSTSPSSSQALQPPSAAESKPEHQWFVDALNSGPVQTLNRQEMESPQANPDFLFGLDQISAAKSGEDVRASAFASPASGLPHPEPRDYFPPPPNDLAMKADRRSLETATAAVVSDSNSAEIQRQIQEFQRMQIASQEQQAAAAYFQRKQEETLSHCFPTGSAFPAREPVAVATSMAGDYYQKIHDKNRYESGPPQEQPPPQPMTILPPPTSTPAAYWAAPAPDRQGMGPDLGVYLLPSGAMYPAGSVRPLTCPPGQGFYTVAPKVMTSAPPPPPAGFGAEPYRDAPIYRMGPTGAKLGPYPEGAIRPGMDAASFAHLTYDPTGGRQMYYAAATQAAVTSPPASYQTVARQPPPQDPKPKSPTQGL
ncbi:hypothetical protein EJ110_NYTH36629 [Nymphaea thermarum]|nr:hypothetical protein EJ110_NYTH36629 [Nymphaea thermarum]